MKEKEAVAIQKIDIKIGQKTLSLTLEQAKELKQILNDMFEERVVHEHHHHENRYWWNWPIYSPPIYPQWTITGGTLTGGGIGNTCSSVTSSLASTTPLSYSSDVTLCLNTG